MVPTQKWERQVANSFEFCDQFIVVISLCVEIWWTNAAGVVAEAEADDYGVAKIPPLAMDAASPKHHYEQQHDADVHDVPDVVDYS